MILGVDSVATRIGRRMIDLKSSSVLELLSSFPTSSIVSQVCHLATSGCRISEWLQMICARMDEEEMRNGKSKGKCV